MNIKMKIDFCIIGQLEKMKDDNGTYLIYWLPLNSWYEKIYEYNNATEIKVPVFKLK
jgi:hypothetical protein